LRFQFGDALFKSRDAVLIVAVTSTALARPTAMSASGVTGLHLALLPLMVCHYASASDLVRDSPPGEAGEGAILRRHHRQRQD
jgi:hypothetical protein